MSKKRVQAIFQVGLACLFWAGAALGQEGSFSLTLLHTSEMTGRFEQLQKAGVVAQRVEKKSAPTLLLHVGAMLSASEEAFKSDGGGPSLTVSLMNQAGYDAWLPGMDDLSLSGGVAPFVRSARFAVLGANFYGSGTGRSLLQVQPYTVVPFGNIRVGILGLGAGGAGTQTAPVLDAARYYVPLVRQEASLVVVLTDQGFAADSALAASVEGIDVILGTREPGGSPRAVNGVWIAYSQGDGNSVGRLGLTIAGGEVTAAVGEQILLDNEPDHPELLAAALQGWSAEVDGEMVPVYTVLGKSGGGFGASLGQSVAMGHLVADLMRSGARTDLAFAAASSLNPQLPAGNIRVLDLYRVYSRPFTLVVFSLKGRQIRAFLEGGMKIPGGFFYPSGLKVAYDLSQPEGERVASLTVGGAPLEDEKTYRVAAEDRIAIPGGAAAGLAEQLNGLERTHLGVSVRNLLVRHARTLDVIQGHIDDRVREQ